MDRFLNRIVLVSVLAAGVWTCGGRPPSEVSVIVLGFDGMDYALTRDLMARGRLPNLAALAGTGGFTPLTTSIPPQSPVAWSTFLTGLDPGGHGIFDFIHRDPETMVPYLSTTVTEPPARTLRLGGWQIPLTGGRVELLRRGQPFWESLERRGIETTIIRMPANFPPSGTATRELSGMGTPDLLGTYGTFSFYTSDPLRVGLSVSGGTVHPVDIVDHVVEATLHGPDNPFRVEAEQVRAKFTVYLDPDQPIAKLVVGDEERVLEQGDWSDWVPVRFGLAPLQHLQGIVRFYLKEVRPAFELYVSPINLDPLDPAMPISTPGSYAADLARAMGRFYTQGMPEDTSSLSEGVLSPAEFLMQARLAGAEVGRQYTHLLDEFPGGFLFYYFGNLDQVGHMMWRPMDPAHPAYAPDSDAAFEMVVEELYVELDAVVGETLGRIGPGTLLVVMSDHGFAPWRRAFHLNAWLHEQGYLAVRGPARHDDPGLFGNVEWSRTRAYGLGLNGLYLNVQGRERWGTVGPEARERLAAEITEKLLQTIDPATGEPAITKVYRREQAYRGVEGSAVAPDLIVGYARGTRASNESALGAVGPEVFTDNTNPWSGDHCMDHETVPGVLLTNRPLGRPAPSLEALAGAILAEFGVESFPSGEH